MSAGLLELASSVRSHKSALEARLYDCMKMLIQDGAPGLEAGAPPHSLAFEPSSFIIYLAEMLDHVQPGAFVEYLRWIQNAFSPAKATAADVLRTLDCLEKVLCTAFPDQAPATVDFMETARVLAETALMAPEPKGVQENPWDHWAEKYLQALLAVDREEAWRIVEKALDQGASIKDIYLKIFQTTQYRIGRLWQKNSISVAQEHYCTATTQLMMSRLYPRLFSGERRNRRFVGVCVGGELHELGVRMVADFFEMDKWDSFYLGAGSSEAALLHGVETHKPHVVGLSATLASHVRRVAQTIGELRRHFGTELKIIVGGQPFKMDHTLWKEVGADGYGNDAQQAVNVAEILLGATS